MTTSEAETTEVFAAAGTADRPGAGIGVVWFATHPASHYALTVVDYQIWEMSDVNDAWIEAIFERSCGHAEQLDPTMRGCPLKVEHAGLLNVLRRAEAAARSSDNARGAFGVRAVHAGHVAQYPPTLDERIAKLRPLVDSGKVIKLATGPMHLVFRGRKVNHLAWQIANHRAGDPASASELMEALVLGLMLGVTPRTSWFDQRAPRGAAKGPFSLGPYVGGKRPL